MNLSTLADLGECVGGVAVLVTLVYLALQVRHGNNQARASFLFAMADKFNRTHETVLLSRDHASLLVKLRSSEDLADPADREQTSSYMASLMNTWQGAQLAYDLGFVDRAFFETICGDDKVMLAQKPGMAPFAMQLLNDYPERKNMRVFDGIPRG